MIAGLATVGVVALVVELLGSDGPAHPDEWDGRVADLAAFVEDERGLDFDHPVYVDFLSAAEYSAQTTEEDVSLADGEREELDRYAGQLRALGVASGELDLFTAFNQVADGGTLAFYDPTDQRVRVRGTEMTVGLEVTIVHELTHALQDQHFDLDRLYAPDLDGGGAAAFRGLAEGDALRVEDAYVTEELTTTEQEAYDEEYAGELEGSKEATADVPPFVSATFGAPYALGRPFVEMLVNQDGNDAVDDAFDEPPTTEEHLFDPTSFLADEKPATDVTLGFDDDEEVMDESTFGATSWYLFLAERIDPKVAFDAARGWDGDAFGSVQRDGSTCVRLAFVGEDGDEEDEMATALGAWIEAMPGEGAELDEVDGHPVLASCDPGEDVDLELTDRSESSLFVPSLWGYLVADAASVLDADEARCYAHTVVEGLTYEQITDPDGAAFAGDEFQETLSAAFEACS
jgi:hypothetical protein